MQPLDHTRREKIRIEVLVEALLDAGAKAPKVTDDLEASEAVRDLLRQREQGV